MYSTIVVFDIGGGHYFIVAGEREVSAGVRGANSGNAVRRGRRPKLPLFTLESF